MKATSVSIVFAILLALAFLVLNRNSITAPAQPLVPTSENKNERPAQPTRTSSDQVDSIAAVNQRPAVVSKESARLSLVERDRILSNTLGQAKNSDLKVEAQIQRYTKPVADLFDEWGLDNRLVELALKSIRVRIQQGNAEIQRQYRDAPHEVEDRTNPELIKKSEELRRINEERIDSEYQMSLQSILGSEGRSRALDSLLFHLDDKARADARPSIATTKFVQEQLAELEKTYGSNFEKMVIEKFGHSSQAVRKSFGLDIVSAGQGSVPLKEKAQEKESK